LCPSIIGTKYKKLVPLEYPTITILPEALGATLVISPFVDKYIISPIGNADVIRFELPLTNIPTLDDVPNAIPKTR
jgi:hypothetical protein